MSRAPGSRPKSVNCYICGRAYGTASIKIHLKSCKEQFLMAEAKKPANKRRPLPPEPALFSIDDISVLSSRQLDNANNEAFRTFNDTALVPCKLCGRTFLPDRLEVHRRSCRPGQEAKSVREAVTRGATLAGGNIPGGDDAYADRDYEPPPPRPRTSGGVVGSRRGDGEPRPSTGSGYRPATSSYEHEHERATLPHRADAGHVEQAPRHRFSFEDGSGASSGPPPMSTAGGFGTLGRPGSSAARPSTSAGSYASGTPTHLHFTHPSTTHLPDNRVSSARSSLSSTGPVGAQQSASNSRPPTLPSAGAGSGSISGYGSFLTPSHLHQSSRGGGDDFSWDPVSVAPTGGGEGARSSRRTAAPPRDSAALSVPAPESQQSVLAWRAATASRVTSLAARLTALPMGVSNEDAMLGIARELQAIATEVQQHA